MFSFLKKNVYKHSCYTCKKNGKKYLIVADSLHEALDIVNKIYFNCKDIDIKEEKEDLDLIKFYGNGEKGVFEVNH